ncbi:hypothetical protein A9Q99_01905 [Gammaproteobacteria bacterium 45_16_T64]|nr:hypothetical protein A9Q99_01905 [Gammaproteobacteria bacterium 45_16_T64]
MKSTTTKAISGMVLFVCLTGFKADVPTQSDKSLNGIFQDVLYFYNSIQGGQVYWGGLGDVNDR